MKLFASNLGGVLGVAALLVLTLVIPLGAFWLLAAAPCITWISWPVDLDAISWRSISYFLNAAFSLCVRENLMKWQTAIGAIVGFNGLLVGGLFNARLNRKRDDRLRAEKGYALAVGLASEIEFSDRILNARGNLLAVAIAEERGITAGHMRKLAIAPPTPIFDNNTRDLGLLPPRLSRKVASLYGRINEFFRYLELIAAVQASEAEVIRPDQFKSAADSHKKNKFIAGPLIVDLLLFANQKDQAKIVKGQLERALSKEESIGENGTGADDDQVESGISAATKEALKPKKWSS